MAQADIISFETGVPTSFSTSSGMLTTTSDYAKLGNTALVWNWSGGDVLKANRPNGLETTSMMATGGVYVWVYNRVAIDKKIRFSFKNTSNVEKCHIDFQLNFTGWRVLQARFSDMKHDASTLVTMEICAPAQGSGCLLFDYLEFPTNVSWERVGDMQFSVPVNEYFGDFVAAYQVSIPTVVSTQIQKNAIDTITARVEEWLLWNGAENLTTTEYTKRKAALTTRMNRARNTNFPAFGLTVRSDGSVKGPALFPQQQTTASNGTALMTFKTVSENTLLPLAYDARLNDRTESTERIRQIYTWYAEQGWNAGSGLGFLRYEKLRSAGFFHSFFLMRNLLDSVQYQWGLDALHWYSLMGYTVKPYAFAGDNTDNLRTLLIAKLYYALMQPDVNDAVSAMTAFVDYSINALSFGAGFSDMLKPDGSGYHHRGVYFGAYYPDGLYASALVCYLLHDTPFALPPDVCQRLKTALLTFSQVAALYDVPTATCGRFPNGSTVLDQMLPAMAYVALSIEDNQELLSVLKRRWKLENQAVQQYISSFATDICHKKTLGEMGLTLRTLALAEDISERESTYNCFMPYAGLLVHRTPQSHLSVKGFSKYVWDFEASDTENLYGRYLSYGQTELTDLRTGKKNTAYADANFNWSLIPGTTTKRLSNNALSYTGGGSKHRNFSDAVFLGGLAQNNVSLFAMQLHDNTFDKTFSANKSVFALGDTILCLGSNICSASTVPVQTTLFQQTVSDSDTFFINDAVTTDFPQEWETSRIFDNRNTGYVVQNGLLRMVKTPTLMQAFVQHGNGCTNASYAYYILPNTTRNTVKHFIAPFEIVRQDAVAHIVKQTTDNRVLMAVFDVSKIINAGHVVRINTPLLLAVLPTANGLLLTLTDPDMHRTSAAGINDLTNHAIYEESGSFPVEIWFDGQYTIAGHSEAKAEITTTGTKLTLTMQHGMQQTLLLTDTASAIENTELAVDYLYDGQQRTFFFYTTKREYFDVALFSLDGKKMYADTLTNGSTLLAPVSWQGVFLLKIDDRYEKIHL